MEEAVYSAGVNQAAAAIAAFRSHGGTPTDALAIVDWWRPRRAAWGFPEVELYHRLKRWHRGELPSEGWLPMLPEYLAIERRAGAAAARRERQDAAQRAAAAERSRMGAEQTRRAELEAQFGDQVRALSAAERDDLGRRHAGAAWQVIRGLTSMSHNTLVDALAGEERGARNQDRALPTCGGQP